tara:strand:+ start:762 stop:1547 length:786 start_codon:yes stop_codon:yes gene_type:complete
MKNVNSFEGLLLDLEGVLYQGDKIIDGAFESINEIKKNNIKIRYLTNTTTTPRKLILNKLIKFGLPVQESDIFSPVIAANNFLNEKKISRIFLLAEKNLIEDFKKMELDTKKPQAVIIGDIYKNFNWDILNKTFQIISDNNSIIIALHKNKYCRRDEKIALDLGPFVSALEYATSSKAFVMGKPEKNFFDLAIKDMNLKYNKVLMIGDDILSDIDGAKKNQIMSIQVKTGKYQKKDESSFYTQPDFRLNSIVDLPSFLGIT